MGLDFLRFSHILYNVSYILKKYKNLKKYPRLFKDLLKFLFYLIF